MTEPEIRLPSRTAHRNSLIRDCKWKLQTFVERDAYVNYDYAASFVRPHCDQICKYHVEAINKAMLARSRYKSWEQFLNSPVPELSAMPYSLELLDSANEQLRPALESLYNLVKRIAATPGITEMAASKVLYLLRPNFVAIADKYVRTCLGIRGSEPAERMIAVQHGIRELASTNRDALDELVLFAKSLGPISPRSGLLKGQSVPVVLTRIRILDILLWSDFAIHGPQPHPKWRQWYLEEVLGAKRN
jgi:hypothetical protein